MNTQSTFAASASPVEETGRMVDARESAVRQIARRRHRAFRIYAGVMVGVNALIVAFWAVLAVAGRLDIVMGYLWPNEPPSPARFFWPIFPIAICSVFVWLSWRGAYPRVGYSDEEIEREMTRYRSSEVPRRGSRAEPAGSASAPSRTPTETGMRTVGPTASESTVAAQRRSAAVQVLVYVVINFVWLAAWVIGGGGFFWPVYLLTVWGVGVLVDGYVAYGPHSGGGSNESGSGGPK